MKLVIFGSRDAHPTFRDIDCAVKALLSEYVYFENGVTEVVCGMARGADECGRDWARQNGIPVKEMPADWTRFGKSAGRIRNAEMADYADAGLGFWKRESGGTANMATHLLVREKPVVVRGA